MTLSTSPLPDEPLSAMPGAPARALASAASQALGAGAIVLLAAVAAWQGGALGSAAVVAVAALAHFRWGRGAPPAQPDGPQGAGPAAPTAAAGRVGAEVMVSQVVPVWSRQMEVTRDVATEGLAKLLENFSGVSGALADLSTQLESFSLTADPGSMDEAVTTQSPALSALLAPSERAFQQRNEVVAVLGRCADALAELQQQAKAAHEISRHTRLVAFNASIEAHRGGAASNGSQAVANELRDLASRMASTGEAVHRLVTQLSQAVNGARRAGEIGDTTPDELQLELQIRAREALSAMLGSVGGSLAGTRAIRESSDMLRNQLDEAFVNFQFGDRVSQMLSIVGNDMSNFAAWVSRHPHATQTDAAEWLEALDASYTMEEQRAHHHGNVHVDRGSEIEFF
jgi:methyl-accepting chemotaxis protein